MERPPAKVLLVSGERKLSGADNDNPITCYKTRDAPHQEDEIFVATDAKGKRTRVCVVGQRMKPHLMTLFVPTLPNGESSQTFQVLDADGIRTQVCTIGSQSASLMDGSLLGEQGEKVEVPIQAVDDGSVMEIDTLCDNRSNKIVVEETRFQETASTRPLVIQANPTKVGDGKRAHSKASGGAEKVTIPLPGKNKQLAVVNSLPRPTASELHGVAKAAQENSQQFVEIRIRNKDDPVEKRDSVPDARDLSKKLDEYENNKQHLVQLSNSEKVEAAPPMRVRQVPVSKPVELPTKTMSHANQEATKVCSGQVGQPIVQQVQQTSVLSLHPSASEVRMNCESSRMITTGIPKERNFLCFNPSLPPLAQINQQAPHAINTRIPFGPPPALVTTPPPNGVEGRGWGGLHVEQRSSSPGERAPLLTSHSGSNTGMLVNQQPTRIYQGQDEGNVESKVFSRSPCPRLSTSLKELGSTLLSEASGTTSAEPPPEEIAITKTKKSELADCDGKPTQETTKSAVHELPPPRAGSTSAKVNRDRSDTSEITIVAAKPTAQGQTTSLSGEYREESANVDCYPRLLQPASTQIDQANSCTQVTRVLSNQGCSQIPIIPGSDTELQLQQVPMAMQNYIPVQLCDSTVWSQGTNQGISTRRFLLPAHLGGGSAPVAVVLGSDEGESAPACAVTELDQSQNRMGGLQNTVVQLMVQPTGTSRD